MKKFPIVEIKWTDAVTGSADEWVELKDLKNKPMPSLTVGYLIKESKEAITVAGLRNENHFGLTLVIPRRMIDKMTELSP